MPGKANEPARGPERRDGGGAGAGGAVASAGRHAVGLIAAGVALLTALTYLPVRSHGFVWDDRYLIGENAALARPGAAARAFRQDFWQSAPQALTKDYYRPLVILSYVFDRRLHGLEPRGYHVANLLLHAAVAGLLCLLLADLGLGAWPAGLGAALFGTHPALVECVAWISGRTDALAALFVLLCLLADRRRGRLPWRITALVACAAALLSKEVAVVTPVLAILAARAHGEPLGEGTRRRWDLLALLALYIVMRRIVLGVPDVRALVAAGGLSLPARLAAMLHLVGILILPGRARLEYGAGLPPSVFLPGSIAGVAVLVFLGLSLRRRSKACGAGALPALVVGGLVAFVPAIVAVLFLSGLGDRLVYLPAAFFLPALVVALGCWLPGRLVAALGLAALVLGTVSTATRCRLWSSERVFFEAAAAAPRASARTFNNLGLAYHREGLLPEAVQALETASGRAPLESAHYLLGLIYMEVGCDDLAVRYYREALALAPAYLPAINNLSALLVERGRFDEADDVLMAALPAAGERTPELQRKLAALRRQRARDGATVRPGHDCGSPEQARNLLRDAPLLDRLGQERLQAREFEPASVLLRAAVRADPGFQPARLDLAHYHVLRGDKEQARELLDEVLRQDPGNEPARRFLRALDSTAAQTPGP